MRLLICAGGTGGGVYPALAVFQALSAEHPGVETLWVGGEGGMEADLVSRAGVPFRTIPAAGLHGVGARALPRNLSALARGTLASRRILADFRPDALFFTGGFLAGPMALAARSFPQGGKRARILVYVPDIEPGLALQWLARFADRIAVSAPESQKYFARKVVVTGYPLRSEVQKWDRSGARKALGLEDSLPVVLVFGGSKGARSINQAVTASLPSLLASAQVVHVTGQLDWDNVQHAAGSLNAEQKARYHAFPYLHEEMGAALAAADVAICRAGASTLGELPANGLPAVLVPYPHAWRYQKVNADYLAQRGGAVILADELMQAQLVRIIRDLLENPAKRQAMKTAMLQLARRDAAAAIAAQLVALGGPGQ